MSTNDPESSPSDALFVPQEWYGHEVAAEEDKKVYEEEGLTAAENDYEFIYRLRQVVSSSEQEMSLKEFEALHGYLVQQHQLDRKSAARAIGRCARLIDAGSISVEA